MRRLDPDIRNGTDGLITRTVDADDRRGQSLALTARGKRLVPQLSALADANERECSGHLPPAAIAALIRHLSDLAAHQGCARFRWAEATRSTPHLRESHGRPHHRIITTCTNGSDSGNIAFPAIIAPLTVAGMERYHADLCRWEKTCFLASGDSLVVPCQRIAGAPATAFSAAGVQAAVHASQAQQIRYHEFCQRALAAASAIPSRSSVGAWCTTAGPARRTSSIFRVAEPDHGHPASGAGYPYGIAGTRPHRRA